MLHLTTPLAATDDHPAPAPDSIIQSIHTNEQATGLVLPAQSLLLLVALLPTRLPEGMYDELMPQWVRAWMTIDNCPEWDLLWLRLFCRARKYTRRFDWVAHIPHFMSYLLCTFSLPLGSVPGPEQKRLPSRFRALFQPPIQHYNRLLLLSKLVVFFLGQGGDATVDVPLRPTPPNPEEGEAFGPVPCSGAARHLVLLLSQLRTYYNPSNSGQWSDELGVFLSYLSGAVARRVGWQAADRDYGYAGGDGGEVAIPALPDRDVTAVVEAILPLAHQSLYSKRSAAIAAGEQALKILACLRPASVARLTVPLLVQALDPSSLNTTHQAPAALKALSVVAQPLLVPTPYLLEALPTLLQWSLPGLDSNDLAKTMATVQFFIAVLDWLPLRGAVPQLAKDGPGFARLLPAPPGDPRAGAPEEEGSEEWAMERVAEAAPALAEWAIAVLERCQALLVAKEGQRGAGVAKTLMGKFESAQALIWRYLFRSLFTQMDAELHAQVGNVRCERERWECICWLTHDNTTQPINRPATASAPSCGTTRCPTRSRTRPTCSSASRPPTQPRRSRSWGPACSSPTRARRRRSLRGAYYCPIVESICMRPTRHSHSSRVLT